MYVREGEIRLDRPHGGSEIAAAGAVVSMPHGSPHTWQVVSDEARFLTINVGRRHGASFDEFVAALGTPTNPDALPEAIEIDPAHVASVRSDDGIDVLGPPPPPLD
jgi:hypothetical protein